MKESNNTDKSDKQQRSIQGAGVSKLFETIATTDLNSLTLNQFFPDKNIVSYSQGSS
jgi:hypothetical protein